MKIKVISGSVRTGRKSHNVALFLEKWLSQQDDTQVSIIDLKERNFPIFEERLSNMSHDTAAAQKFSDEIKEADAIIVVVPEYNGGYPAALKNVIDILYDEWQHKPIALAPVSSGDMAGAQVAQQIEFIFYKIGARVIKSRFHVAKVQENFKDDGSTTNEQFFNKNANFVFEGLKSALK